MSTMYGLRQVVEGISLDLDILAQCFERIAAERKFEVEGQAAELVSTILRHQVKVSDRSGIDRAPEQQ